MFVFSKRNQKKKSDWCIILKPIDSELSKTKIIERIVDLFPLSGDEASQLVERTPIIFLEKLPLEKAKSIRNMFQESSAYLQITDDMFEKRKCYRTVWPRDPFKKIGTVTPEEGSSIVEEKETKLSKDSAIENIRKQNQQKVDLKSTKSEASSMPAPEIADKTGIPESLSTQADLPGAEKKVKASSVEKVGKASVFQSKFFGENRGRNEFQYLSLELETTKEEIKKRDRKIEKLEERIRKMKQVSGNDSDLDDLRQAFDKQQDELREKTVECEGLQNECDVLKEKYASADKRVKELQDLKVEHDELKNKYEYLEDEIRDFAARKSEFEDIKASIAEKDALLRKKDEELLRANEAREEMRAKIEYVENEYSAQKERAEKDRQVLQQTIANLEAEADESAVQYAQIVKERDSLDASYNKLKADVETMHEIDSLYSDLKEKCSALENENRRIETLEKDLQTSAELRGSLENKLEGQQNYGAELEEKISGLEQQIDMLRQEHQKMIDEKDNLSEGLDEEKREKESLIEETNKRVEELKAEKEKLTELLKDLQSDNERLSTELTDVRSGYEKTSAKCAELSQEVERLSSVKTEFVDLELRYEKTRNQDAEKERELEDLKTKYQSLESRCHDYISQKDDWRAKYEKVEKDFEDLKTANAEFIREREKFVELGRTYNEMRSKYIALKDDLERLQTEKEIELKMQRETASEYKKDIERLESECERLNKQVEVQQRTIRDITSRKESEQYVQKRVQIQESIATTELALKELVKGQELLEDEIREREKRMKEILNKQETIEKDLVNLKQEHKHLAEKARQKEKQAAKKEAMKRGARPAKDNEEAKTDAPSSEVSVEEMSYSN